MPRRAIVFADVVSSTQLYDKLGDVPAKGRVQACLDLISKTVKTFQGRVVKSLGDGILATFDSEQHAAMATLAMCEETSASPLDIRVGVHCGDVVEENGDVFGDVVNVAARISGIARTNEILISDALKQTLPEDQGLSFRPVPAVSVKGKRDPLQVFTLYSTVPGLTAMWLTEVADPSMADCHTCCKLELRHADQEIVLGPGSSLTIGRAPDSGIVVQSGRVSRVHARISWRQSKFVLVDESANGTYLSVPSGGIMHLVREEAILQGSGMIFADTNIEPIQFRIL